MFQKYARHFHEEIPTRPSGKYAHLVVLRHTDSYGVFKTDGELNTALVAAGISDTKPMTRVTIFKRKQSTAERLTGRELLRRHGVIGNNCRYNEAFCGECPDCILYGYAIGDTGSEKSKVYTDTCYSVTSYDESHETFTLNAPFEDGTMTRGDQTTNRFSEQDHVVPGVFFPSVVTLRDPTPEGLAYVINNIRRTKLYGAQTSRTGHMANEVLAMIFADGEIFSNLRLTQGVYDWLRNSAKYQTPLQEAEVRKATLAVAEELVKRDGVSYDFVSGEALEALLEEVEGAVTDDEHLGSFLKALGADTASYAKRAAESEDKKKGKA
ncbi:MAG: type I-D CRISPR-associated protein Cas7/Csc2 [Bacillota bacterium]